MKDHQIKRLKRQHRQRVREQFRLTDRGALGLVHIENPSRLWVPMQRDENHEKDHPTLHVPEELWFNDVYYANCVRFESGWFVGGGPHATIGISSNDETSRHDWRDFQHIKTDIVGAEWEAVELYPAESRHVDPSNRFYLWCVPKDVLQFGYFHRRVWPPIQGGAPQRPFSK